MLSNSTWFLKLLVGNVNDGGWVRAQFIQHAHYFDSLTPNQNNKDFCQQIYSKPGNVQWCVMKNKDPVFWSGVKLLMNSPYNSLPP